jgi:trimeric autotransporter adhesin
MHTLADPESMRLLPPRRSARLAALLVTALGVTLGACTESLPPATVNSLRISPANDSFFVGQTTAASPFSVTLLDANSSEIRDSRLKVAYSSSNPAAFTVDATTGALTGVAAGGGLYRASIGGKFIDASVKIILPLSKIQIITPPQTLQVGSTVQIQYILLGSDNSAISGRTVNFSSSNPTVLSVSSQGLVSAVSVGTSKVTLGAEGKLATIDFTVEKQLVSSIRLTPTIPQLMRVGGTLQMSATPLDNANQPIPDKTINWSTFNPSVASVSSTGLVTALVPGTTTIFAEADNRTASLPVTVTLVPVGSVTFAKTSDTLVVGDQKQFLPVVKDTAGRVINSLNGRNVVWQTTNIPVATVSGQGVVTADAVGSATISVTVDGKDSDNTVALKVSQVATINVSPTSVSLARGASQQLTITLLDGSGNVLTTTRGFTTATGNSSIATLTSGGVVNAGQQVGRTNLTLSLNGVQVTIPVTVN